MSISPTVRVFLITSAIVLIAAGALFYFFDFRNKGAAVSNTSSATTTTTLPDGSTITLPPGATVSEQDVTPPNYKTPIAFSSDVDASAQTSLNVQFAAAVATLDKTPNNFNAWMSIGVLRKIGGDYSGAAEDWEYVAAALPNNYIAFYDLGDLYVNTLKEYPKAETDFKQAIALKPDYIDAYRSLYTLYHYVYKNDASASAILDEGLKNNPGNSDLLALQAQLQAGN